MSGRRLGKMRVLELGVAGALLALLAVGCGGTSTSRGERQVREGGAGGIEGAPDPTASAGNAAASSSSGGSSGAGIAGGTGGRAGAAAGSAGFASGGNAGVTGDGSQTEVPPDCVTQIAPTPERLRLRADQYDRTVRDLLGLTALDAAGGQPPSSLFPPETWPPTDPAYQVLAADIAAQVVVDVNLRERFTACAPSAGASCWHDTIESFGRRAFRRPLTSAEAQTFDDLVAAGGDGTNDGTKDPIGQALLTAFLSSPSFYEREETSTIPDGRGHFVLTPYEVAARLSYLLWGSMPDVELDAVVEAGQLVTPAQIGGQTVRMLADPKAHEGVAAFHRDYVQMSSTSAWFDGAKDPELYPQFSSDVEAAAAAEIDRFFDAVVFDGPGSFRDLFLSPLAFVNAATAPLYGLDPSGRSSALEAVNLDPAARPGFLTRVGFLATYSHYTTTSPSFRGNFIDRVVLDVNVGPSLGDNQLAPPAPEPLTSRERIEQLTSPASCRGCHVYVDPPGFVLEAFDAIGRAQTVDAVALKPVDTLADVIIDGNPVTISAPLELMTRLASSQDAARKYARDWLAFAYGGETSAADECLAEKLGYALRQPDYTILELLLDVTLADDFRLRLPGIP